MSSPDLLYLVRYYLKGIKSSTGAYGWQDIEANTDSIVDDIFESRGNMAAAMLTKFKAKAAAGDWVTFGEEFPFNWKEIPYCYVQHTSVSQAETPMGYVLGNDYDRDTVNTTYPVYGWFNDEVVRVVVLAENPLIRDDLFLVFRELLSRAFQKLQSDGIHMPQLMGGRRGGLTVSPEEGTPFKLSTGEISLRCKTTTQYEETDTVLDGVVSSEYGENEDGQVQISTP